MMLSPVLDRENGDWVFLSWQLSLSCVMGVLAYMVFVWQGSARWGIAAALLIVLLVWLIGEAMMLKYISALPQEKDQVEEAEKVSKSWIFLRKKYRTLDEDLYESRRSRRIRRSTQSGQSRQSEQSGQTGNTEDKEAESTSETLLDSPDTEEASPETEEPSVDDSVETTVIPMSEMQAYLRRLQDESPQGISR